MLENGILHQGQEFYKKKYDSQKSELSSILKYCAISEISLSDVVKSLEER